MGHGHARDPSTDLTDLASHPSPPVQLSPDALASVVVPEQSKHDFLFSVREKEDSFCSLLEFWRPHGPLSFVVSGIHGDFGYVWV